MASGRYRFDRFTLDTAERRLWRDTTPVELNARYLDALALLLAEPGRLLTKERFLDEVWHGVPVTDEALTQCIKTLRRQLGDRANGPRFIETVPKHGYRFIAPVERLQAEAADQVLPSPREPSQRSPLSAWQQFLLLGGAGTTGGGVAGVIGGLFFGFAGASQSLQTGMGTVSVLLVLLSLTILMSVIGAAGVSFGIAATVFAPERSLSGSVVGGAGGGLVVGAIVNLLGIDAFRLLFGQAPTDITGAGEGVLLGAAVGIGLWLACRDTKASPLGRSVGQAALAGAAVGMLIPLLGGRLFGGSLVLLSDSFPDSRLRLAPFSGLSGDGEFGMPSQILTGGLEGALFAACIVAAMVMANRRLQETD